MKVKNISGHTLSFQAGTRNYVTSNNAVAILDDNSETLNDVIEHVRKGRLEIVTLPPVAQYSGTPQLYGYAEIALGSGLADEDTLTIAGVTFEIDEAADGVEGANIAVTAADATANGVTADGLKAAINANTTLSKLGLVVDDVIKISNDDARIIIKAKGAMSIADADISKTGGFTITETDSADSVGYRTATVKVVATSATPLINTGLDSIFATFVSVRTAAGAVKAYDGTVTIGGGFVHLGSDGDVDIAATDVIVLQAVGK